MDVDFINTIGVGDRKDWAQCVVSGWVNGKCGRGE